MGRRFIDLSIFLANDVISDPPFMRPRITYKTHAETMAEAGHFFPGVSAAQLPGGAGLPAYGYTIACFPHKVRGASAGWTRAVAIFDE